MREKVMTALEAEDLMKQMDDEEKEKKELEEKAKVKDELGRVRNRSNDPRMQWSYEWNDPMTMWIKERAKAKQEELRKDVIKKQQKQRF